MFFRAGGREALIFAFYYRAYGGSNLRGRVPQFQEEPESLAPAPDWSDGNRTASKLSTGGSAAGCPSVVGGGVGGSTVRVN